MHNFNKTVKQRIFFVEFVWTETQIIRSLKLNHQITGGDGNTLPIANQITVQRENFIFCIRIQHSVPSMSKALVLLRLRKTELIIWHNGNGSSLGKTPMEDFQREAYITYE